jgi:HAT1-interacting factor 1
MAELVEPPTTASEIPEEISSATEVFNSVKVSLADLCAKGTAQYARKNYEDASDLYARASELQAELNGEMSPENAEILFLYGRSLFKVGQTKSDVLGGKAGGEKRKPNGAVKPNKPEQDTKEAQGELDSIAEEGVAVIPEQTSSSTKAEETGDMKKPLFQFTGDENFEDSDEDAEVNSPVIGTVERLTIHSMKMAKGRERMKMMILGQHLKFLILPEFSLQNGWRNQKS